MAFYDWNLGGSLNFVDTTGSLNADTFNNIIDEVIYPIGAIIAHAKTFTGVPTTTPDSWAECNGQVLSDTDSIFNNIALPDLNGSISGTQRFIRGGLASGEIGGSATHKHIGTTGTYTGGMTNSGGASSVASTDHVHNYTTAVGSNIPIYYTVVWMMRIK